MGSERASIEAKLKSFIVDRLLDGEPSHGEDPLDADVVDSLGVEQLAEYIEREFGVTIDGEDMTWANFSSIPVLAAFVDRRLKSAR